MYLSNYECIFLKSLSNIIFGLFGKVFNACFVPETHCLCTVTQFYTACFVFCAGGVFERHIDVALWSARASVGEAASQTIHSDSLHSKVSWLDP